MSEIESFFKSAFSVDNVIFGFDGSELKVLLIQRGAAPFKGKWALPGDLVYPNEDLDPAAERVLEQLTGLRGVYLEQVKAFGAVNRHPLGREITIAYYSLIKISDFAVTPASFAQSARWHAVSEVEELAIDHNEILNTCLKRLKHKVRTEPVGFEHSGSSRRPSMRWPEARLPAATAGTGTAGCAVDRAVSANVSNSPRRT